MSAVVDVVSLLDVVCSFVVEIASHLKNVCSNRLQNNVPCMLELLKQLTWIDIHRGGLCSRLLY